MHTYYLKYPVKTLAIIDAEEGRFACAGVDTSIFIYNYIKNFDLDMQLLGHKLSIHALEPIII